MEMSEEVEDDSMDEVDEVEANVQSKHDMS